MDNQRSVGAEVREHATSNRQDGPEASEDVLRRARRRALNGVVFAVTLLPVVVAVTALAEDLWLRVFAAGLAIRLPIEAVRSLREYRHPNRTLRPTLRDVLRRTLDRRETEGVPFPNAGSIPERIYLLQNDLDLLEEGLHLNTRATRLLSVWTEKNIDGPTNTLTRLFTTQISYRTLRRCVVVVSLIFGLVEAIVMSASGATAVGAAVLGAVVAVFAFLIGYAALVLGMQMTFGDKSESRGSRAANILRAELATARRALSEDDALNTTVERRGGYDIS